MSRRLFPPRRLVRLALLTLSLMAALLTAPANSIAQDENLPVSPAGLPPTLVIDPVVTVGQNGFTSINPPVDSAPGKVVFRGVRNGQDAIWLVEGASITQVAGVGTVLPNGQGTINSAGNPRISPNGDIVFDANITGGSLPAGGGYVLRWRSGTLIVATPTGDTFTHVLNKPNRGFPMSDGRWLVVEETGDFPRKSFHYSLTDGETVTPLVTLTDTAVDGPGSGGFFGWCTRTERRLYAVNAAGVYAFSERTFQNDPCFFPNITRFSEWSIKLGGAVEATLISGSYTNAPGVGIKGQEPRFNDPILSEANEFVFVRLTLDPTANPKVNIGEVLAVKPGSQRVLFPAPGPNGTTMSGGVTYLDAEGRIAGVGVLNTNARLILKGNSFANDALIQDGDPLFGSTLLGFQPDISVHQLPGGSGENRVFVFQYTLADGTVGIARIGKPAPRWTNAGGGAWATGANWSTASVPLETDDVTFGPAATYDVQVGTRTVSNVAVEAGSPAMRSADLTISNELLVGNNGHLTLPEGKLVATETSLGFLPPASLANPLTATLTLLNAGTRFTSTTLSLGAAAPAHLFIANGAAANTPIATIGVGFPASAIVGGEGSDWQTNSLRVGAGVPATLIVEEGGFVGTPGVASVGGAGSLPPAASALAEVRIGVDDNPSGDISAWFVGGPLEIGQGMDASVEVGRRGLVVVANGVTLGKGGFGTLEVEGGQFDAQAEMEVATDRGAFVRITAGGLLYVGNSLEVGTNSGAIVVVAGRSPDGSRASTLQVDSASDGQCNLSRSSIGVELLVGDGGRFVCRSMMIGVLLNSEARVHVGIEEGGGTLRGESITVGGDGAPDLNGRGLVELNGGRIEATETVRILPRGVITGTGLISATLGVINFGSVNIEGGIRLSSALCGALFCPAASAAQAVSAQVAAFQPGVLTVNGPLTLTTSSKVRLDVGGATPALYDRLVVSGPVALGGELVINFANGFVPGEGQTFNLIGAGATTGAFSKVTVSGLPAGFKYAVSASASGFAFTVTDDGVANTPQVKLFMPVVRK